MARRSKAFFLLAVMLVPEEFCARSSAMISNPEDFGSGINATKCNRTPAGSGRQPAASYPPRFGERVKISVLRRADAVHMSCHVRIPVLLATLWRLHARMV